MLPNVMFRLLKASFVVLPVAASSCVVSGSSETCADDTALLSLQATPRFGKQIVFGVDNVAVLEEDRSSKGKEHALTKESEVDSKKKKAEANAVDKVDFFEDGNVQFDMAAEHNWRKMVPEDWDSFGPSSKTIVSGSNSTFIEFANVCISARDGILIPENNAGYANSLELSTGAAKDGSGANIFTEPMNPKILPRMARPNAYLLSGAALFGSCWRQGAQSRNPSHFMFGHGLVFGAAAFGDRLPNVSHVLYHECALLDEPGEPEWPMAKFVVDLIERRAVEVGLFSRAGTNRVSFSRAGTNWGWYRGLPPAKEPIVCVERMVMSPRLSYLGETHNSLVVDEWRQTVAAYLGRQPEAECERPSAPREATLAVQGCPKSCSRDLRVAVWQRSNRLLANADDVAALLAEYTDQPIIRLAADEKTPPEDQIKNFRCFDVLITVHGSQLTNMIFTPSSEQVFVEITTVPGADDPGMPFCQEGRIWAGAWVTSYGHTPVKPDSGGIVNTELLQKWDACFARIPKGLGSNVSSYVVFPGKGDHEDGKCNLAAMRSGAWDDRFVNLRYLKEDFFSAVRARCKCAGAPEPFPCSKAAYPEQRLRTDAEVRGA